MSVGEIKEILGLWVGPEGSHQELELMLLAYQVVLQLINVRSPVRNASDCLRVDQRAGDHLVSALPSEFSI